MGCIEKTGFRRWAHSLAALIILVTACNWISPSPTPFLPTETPSSGTSPIITETSTASATPVTFAADTPSSATEETYPAWEPWPTSTAIPTLPPGQALTFASLHMNDEQNGWGIAGERIVRTRDGGQTWKDVTPNDCPYRDIGFFALDANTAWATSYSLYAGGCALEQNQDVIWGTIWHTADGGSTWQEQPVCLLGEECDFNFAVAPAAYYPVALHFVDERSGWLLLVVDHVMFQDRYRIYQTKDGGSHWVPVIDSMGGPLAMSVTGLAFQDRQTGWMSISQVDGAAEQRAEWGIYRSSDAGLTWEYLALPEPNPLPQTFAHNTAWCGADGVALLPPNALGVIVHCKVYEPDFIPSYDFYFHSADGGKTWTSWQKTGDVDFIDPSLGWRSVLNNGVYDLEQTRDGGQTWAKVKTVIWNGELEFVNEQVGWAIAAKDNVVTLVHTTDGGKTWEEMKPVVAAR